MVKLDYELQDGDLVELITQKGHAPSKGWLKIVKTDTYQKGDIVLYKSSEGHYVLHRILKIKKDKVILAGDHNPFKDKPIEKSQILGVLSTISKKDGKIFDLTKDKRARRFFYTNFFHIKAFFQRIGNLLHLRKIKD